ncbi:M24 family metallopeptidase [Mesoaciditoga lauensis]|uniref:M24 family metallopeptidase n=1 Tax=Mesoaciditoga lauensis TaxID=1495039 RepID=UPI0005673D14|nr:aminopeptidase P family protein [Mesoaciditoga lauensis]
MKRSDKMVEFLKEKGLDYFVSICSEGSNKTVRYFSRFSGDTGAVVIGEKERFLIVDSRFYTQASQESNFEMVKVGNSSLVDKIAEIVEGKKIGIEESKMFYAWYKTLSSKASHIENVEEKVAQLRASKDEEEIKNIRKAIEVAQNALSKTLEKFHAGMTEREFAAILEFEMIMGGAQKPSFDTIVASGYRGALPHGLASDKKIENGEMMVVDFGALVNGYCSDMTRTFAIGKVPQKAKDAYNAVLNAQMTAMKAAKAGMIGKEIDAIARNVLEEAGLGSYFTHSLGHSLGMDVHEPPFLSPRYEKEIPSHAVVTFEPGVYIPGEFGIRIEDDVLLTPDGYDCLSSFNKEFTQI